MELKEGHFPLGAGPWRLILIDATKREGAIASIVDSLNDDRKDDIDGEGDSIAVAVVDALIMADHYSLRLPLDAAQALGEWASTAAREIALSLVKDGERCLTT